MRARKVQLSAGSKVSGRVRKGAFSLRWDPGFAEAAYRDGHWVDSTLVDALEQAAVQTPERVLVVDGDAKLDCGHVHRRAHALAQALLSRMAPGSVVSFMLPNWHEAVEIYLGITLAGMVAHPVLPSLRDSELRFQLQDTDSRLIFVPAQFRRFDYVAMLGRVLEGMESAPEAVVLRGAAGNHTAYADLFGDNDARRALPQLDPDAVRLVMYTSGTTGRSKGVLHTHNSVHALMRQLGRHWRVDPGDTFLVPSPISHIGGSIYAFEAPLLLGSRAVLMDRWEAEAGLWLAEREACTHICGATPFLEQLLEAAQRLGTSLPSLKLFVCGGASVPPDLIRRAAAHFTSAAITRVYGSTEVPVTTVGCPHREDLAQAAETDGRPGIASIRIAGEPAGGDGEVRVRGPQMLAGYLDPESEDAVFDEDGYYRTGDLGHWQDGCLVITGRSKDIIIRHGENIAPKEVEDLLLAHPQVGEVAIVGLPDPRTGERACAVVVPAAGQAAPDVPSLATFLAGHGVAPFKFPEQVEAWPSLPRNDTGKVLKHVIRATLLERAQTPERGAST